MGYYVDIESISINSYKEKLKKCYLPPSRKILREMPDERFGYFESIGINNLAELLKLLKKMGSITDLSSLDLFPEVYLKILLTEIKSSMPVPNRIKDFIDVPEDVVARLDRIGIKNTKKLYYRIITQKDREELEKESGISYSDIMKLTRLTDLSRIKYAGATFSHMLIQLGFDTARKASEADYVELHEKINQINQDKGYYKGKIGLNDIKVFVDESKNVPLDVEY
jgi:uncharacterized protein DUF4332